MGDGPVLDCPGKGLVGESWPEVRKGLEERAGEGFSKRGGGSVQEELKIVLY